MADFFVDAAYLGGDYLRIKDSLSRGENVVVTGLSAPYKALVAASCGKKVLYITSDFIAARNIYTRLIELGSNAVLLPEKYDYLTFKLSVNPIQNAQRIDAVYKLVSGGFDVMVASVESLTDYFPTKEQFCSMVTPLIKGEQYDYSSLLKSFVAAGYSRVEKVETRGDFSVKGDIIDIYAISSDAPLRLMFFDDTLESIKLVAEDSMMTIREIDEFEVLPVTDMPLPKDVILSALNEFEIYAKRKNTTRLNEIFEDLKLKIGEGSLDEAIWWLVPYALKNLVTVGDVLPEKAVVLYDEVRLIDDKTRLLANEFKARAKALIEGGEITEKHMSLKVAQTDLYANLAKHTLMAYMPPTTINTVFTEYSIYNFKCVNHPSYYLDRAALLEDLNRFSYLDYTVILCCRDKAKAESYRDSLSKDDIGTTLTLSDLDRPVKGIHVTDSAIENGFVVHGAKFALIGCGELMRFSQKTRTSRKKTEVFTIPEIGEYIVHEEHGIGVCEGLQRVKGAGYERDFVVITYKGGDRLYVPIENMDFLSRFSGKEGAPTLSKLGGKDFERIKEKVKKDIKKMAFDLLELYTKRQTATGHKYSSDTVWQEEFESMFPYEPTVDQVTAIAEIKEELESGKVMDRLLCGDVGYGKTEVALRAAFKVAIEGKQVAFLCPTTILALQHYNNLIDRFKHFGVKCDLLCRFKSSKEIKASLVDIKEGKVDLIVATHRLLSKDVEFKDLGLLILDEEQRFGVEHKEKIKNLRNNVNVLSLSATPIPRTLNMAMNGIRDISLLETPPAERISVQTYVTEYTESLVIDAVTREINRGGQVFILYNRVETINAFSSRIEKIVEGAVVAIAHGQMSSIELESSIAKFYNKECNVLVCTTIIQNGIDLPDANTLIVIDADRLGLSELYQLRGRVGRSNRLAYAYFTVKQDKTVTEKADKRLSALLDYTDFGSGFKIAMRDLEIRGAGNLLGREQHGHIAKVGYEMYNRLLEESVAELKGKKLVAKIETEMQVDIDAFVAEEYAEKLGGRMRLYKKISNISSLDEKNALYDECLKTAKTVPTSLVNLMNIALAKSLASNIGIVKVVLHKNLFEVIFSDNSIYSNQSVMKTISEYANKCSLKAEDRPKIDFNEKSLPKVKQLEFLITFLEKCNDN